MLDGLFIREGTQTLPEWVYRNRWGHQVSDSGSANTPTEAGVTTTTNDNPFSERGPDSPHSPEPVSTSVE